MELSRIVFQVEHGNASRINVRTNAVCRNKCGFWPLSDTRGPHRGRLRLLQQRDELRHAVQLGFDQIERGEGLDINTDEELREFFDDIKREEPQQLERRSET